MSEPATSTATATATPEDSTTGDSEQAASKTEEVKPKENGTDVNEDSKPPEPEAPAAPAKPKYRHDWYQTPTDVYVNVMIKGLKNEDVSVNFEEKMASQNSFEPILVYSYILAKIVV